MDLKTGIFSLALGTLLLGSTARADGTQQLQAPQNNNAQVQAQGFRGGPEQTYSWGHGDDRQYRDRDDDHDRWGHDHDRWDHDNDRWGRHTPQPPAPQGQQGRYELKSVQQWVPGRYEQVWVPQDYNCRPRWGSPNCTGGYYNQQWVEGHYETVQQWVWVPERWHRGSGWGTPAGYWHD